MHLHQRATVAICIEAPWSQPSGTRLRRVWVWYRLALPHAAERAQQQRNVDALMPARDFSLAACQVYQDFARPCPAHQPCSKQGIRGARADVRSASQQDEPYLEGDSYLDSDTGFYDDVYGDYVFDEAEAQTSTCTVDQFTGKVLLTGAANALGTMPCDDGNSRQHGLSVPRCQNVWNCQLGLRY